MQGRNNDVHNAVHISLGRGVPITRYNQAQEVALVTADKFSKPVPALFHPQDSGMCIWSLLQIESPPHQRHKDSSSVLGLSKH